MVTSLFLPRRTFLGASIALGITAATGCSVVSPTPDWGTLLPHLQEKIESGLVIKISADAKRVDVVDEEHTLHTWRNGSWSEGKASGDDLPSLQPFELTTFDLGNIEALLAEHGGASLVARQENTYLQPVLTVAKGDGPNNRVNFIKGMQQVPRLDYVKPEDVDLAVRSLAKAASVAPVSISLAAQNATQDAVFFFGVREKRPIYLFRRPDMPVQWVGREPGQKFDDLKSFDLNAITPGSLAHAMNQLRERGKNGILKDPAATWYALKGRPSLGVECNWEGMPRTALADDDGNLPPNFLKN